MLPVPYWIDRGWLLAWKVLDFPGLNLAWLSVRQEKASDVEYCISNEPCVLLNEILVIWVLLTASSTAAVDRGNPEVGRTGVEDNLEGLRRSANGDHTIVGNLFKE